MSDEVEKYDEFGDLSLPEEKGEDSNLDEYGVWIKKKPSAEVSEEVEEEKEVPFDFDGLSEDDSSQGDVFTEELKETEVTSSEASDSTFDDIDMSNFFTNIENSEEETVEREGEEALKMDLNFDTVGSYVDEGDSEDFDSVLNDVETSGDAELDDFLSDLNSSSPSSAPSVNESKEDVLSGQDIDLSIDVDENQDFSNIGKTSEAEESIILPSPVSEITEPVVEEKHGDTVVIKNTVVNPENIDEIFEENRKIMGEDHKKEVSDIEALANDLTSDISTATSNFVAKAGSPVSVEGLDKITDLLTEIVRELSSMKGEISALKASSSPLSGEIQEKKDEEPEEATGFFKDEDTDEAIALTGDELNNILITADFTEEDEPNVKVDEESSGEDMGTCEACSDDEVVEKLEDDNVSSEKDVDFDDITLENSKLDDFVIPEELDYSMLNNEDGKVASTEGSDMSYLDEKDSEDDVSIDIPETQDISIGESQEEPVSSGDGDKEALPSNIKQEVKSVLSYMDQLLESLPEDKMKEFAESEYFEMYNRLFSELGIS